MSIAPLVIAASASRRRQEDRSGSWPSLQTMERARRYNEENDAATMRFLVKCVVVASVLVGGLIMSLSFLSPAGMSFT